MKVDRDLIGAAVDQLPSAGYIYLVYIIFRKRRYLGSVLAFSPTHEKAKGVDAFIAKTLETVSPIQGGTVRFFEKYIAKENAENNVAEIIGVFIWEHNTFPRERNYPFVWGQHTGNVV